MNTQASGNQVATDLVDGIYVEKEGCETISRKDGIDTLQVRIKANVNSTIIENGQEKNNNVETRGCITGLSNIVTTLNEDEVVYRARKLWDEKTDWNISVLIYRTPHPDDIKLPEDLETVMIPSDPDDAESWVKMVSTATPKRKNYKELKYIGSEFVKVINLFCYSGYVIEDPDQQKAYDLDGIGDIAEMLADSPREPSVIKLREKEHEVQRRFRENVFIPAIRLFRKSFKANGIEKKLIVTDVDIELASKILNKKPGGKTLTLNNRLLEKLVIVKDVPLCLTFTDKDRILTY